MIAYHNDKKIKTAILEQLRAHAKVDESAASAAESAAWSAESAAFEIIPGLRLCQDCRFFQSDTDKCGHASALSLDYVRGNHRRFNASTQRFSSSARDCGEDAQFFEPRGSVVQLVKDAAE